MRKIIFYYWKNLKIQKVPSSAHSYRPYKKFSQLMKAPATLLFPLISARVLRGRVHPRVPGPRWHVPHPLAPPGGGRGQQGPVGRAGQQQARRGAREQGHQEPLGGGGRGLQTGSAGVFQEPTNLDVGPFLFFLQETISKETCNWFRHAIHVTLHMQMHWLELLVICWHVRSFKTLLKRV